MSIEKQKAPLSDIDAYNLKQEAFYKELEDLPEDAANSMREKFDSLADDEEINTFLEEFDAYILNRKKTLAMQSIEIHPDTDPAIWEEILEVHESIKRTFGDSNFFINNGATAEVYILPVAPHLCVKYITDQEKYNENNHMRVEYGFLDQLHNFEVDGIRAPHPYFLRIHPSEGHSYGMERIDGESLSLILEKPEKNIELIEMVRKLNREQVGDALISYIKAMHKKFNITHRDLAKRNVMVDKQGNFYIIDFGKAKRQEIGEDHETFRNSDIARLSAEVRDFFKRVDEIDIDAIIASVSSAG